MRHRRYSTMKDGTWMRSTLAFESARQWEERTPHADHGAHGGNRRTGNKPLPPRKYHTWPVFEAAPSEKRP